MPTKSIDIAVHRHLAMGNFGRVYLVTWDGTFHAMKMSKCAPETMISIENLCEIQCAAILKDARYSCVPTHTLLGSDAMLAIMPYIPFTLKDLHPWVDAARPANSGSERADMLAHRQSSEDDLVAGQEEEGQHTPPRIPDGSVLRVLVEVDDANVTMLPTLSICTFMQVLPSDASSSSSLQLIQHPGQEAYEEMLKKALAPIVDARGWNVFVRAALTQLTRALVELEAFGIMHCDMKSSNVGVLVEEVITDKPLHEEEEVGAYIVNGIRLHFKLIDFGSVRQLHRPATAHNRPNSRSCPPEFLMEQPPYHAGKTDIWGVAAVIGGILVNRAFWKNETSAMRRKYDWIETVLFDMPPEDEEGDDEEDDGPPSVSDDVRIDGTWIHMMHLHRSLATFDDESQKFQYLTPATLTCTIDRLQHDQPWAKLVDRQLLDLLCRMLMYRPEDRVTPQALLASLLLDETSISSTYTPPIMPSPSELCLTDTWHPEFVQAALHRCLVPSNKRMIVNLFRNTLPTMMKRVPAMRASCRRVDEQAWLGCISLIQRFSMSRHQIDHALASSLAVALRMCSDDEEYTLEECFIERTDAVTSLHRLILECGGWVDAPGYYHVLQSLAVRRASQEPAICDWRQLHQLSCALLLAWFTCSAPPEPLIDSAPRRYEQQPARKRKKTVTQRSRKTKVTPITTVSNEELARFDATTTLMTDLVHIAHALILLQQERIAAVRDEQSVETLPSTMVPHLDDRQMRLMLTLRLGMEQRKHALDRILVPSFADWAVFDSFAMLSEFIEELAEHNNSSAP